MITRCEEIGRLCEICVDSHELCDTEIDVAEYVLHEIHEGEEKRTPACERHYKAAQRYRIAHGIPLDQPLRAPPSDPNSAGYFGLMVIATAALALNRDRLNGSGTAALRLCSQFVRRGLQ